MANNDIALMTHLLRRAGFGASRAEVESRSAQGYEATVEELLNPNDHPGIEEDLLFRYPNPLITNRSDRNQCPAVDVLHDQQSEAIAGKSCLILAHDFLCRS
ncbi:MAG: hypothetical protein CM1200mP15_14820 [Dehalococcoidia bacterium]|nr:MAG: hypothetical protein CM1200mP15_14820 [Dehalococcoidia bacterium]